ADALKVGDAFEVMVLGVDQATGRVSLGRKQLEPDPWKHFADTYKDGSVVTGKVSHLTDYGVFVALDDGIEGLVHISEISWSHRVKDPATLFTVGQEIKAMVLKIDRTTKRISLGIKQLEPSPWEKATEDIAVGSRISGAVTSGTDYGAFVEIAPGVDGLIHNTDLTWSSRIRSAKEMLKIGDTVDPVVLSVDKDKHRI